MEENNNIYLIFDWMLIWQDKEEFLKQCGVMIWFIGLSGLGKSIIVIVLECELYKCGLLCCILDGDNICIGINNNLGFFEIDWVENICCIVEVLKFFIDIGIIIIVVFISFNNDICEMVVCIVGLDDFLEIFVSILFVECEKWDVKGLYVKVCWGEIKNFIGIFVFFEVFEYLVLLFDIFVLLFEEFVN